MLATHDQFTHQMRNRLKSTCIGLGLVRLLQDAKRFEEAGTTLYLLEGGFQGVAEESDKPSQKSLQSEPIEWRHQDGFLFVGVGINRDGPSRPSRRCASCR